MFSEQLENLIQASIENGTLEKNEKAALVKRAQREGVDLDELEIYINSLLQRRQRELNEKKNQQEKLYEKKKKEAIGPVCPKCGKQVTPLTIKCDCGYEFTKEKRESSIKLLSEKIEKLRDQEMLDAISLFPVPNTKEDIVEFLAVSVSLANLKLGLLDTKRGYLTVLLAVIVFCLILIIIFYATNMFYYGECMFWISLLVIWFGMLNFGAKDFFDEKLRNAWRAKFYQVLILGRSLRGDSEFTQQLNYYENLLNNE